MTTDTIALFDIASESATADRLCSVLTADPGFASALIARYRPLWNVPTWMITTAPLNDEPELIGPGGFVLRWRGRTLELYHMMTFGTFASNEWASQALRQACHQIATLVGSTQVLYTHELMPHQGDDLQAIAQWLQDQIGPPAVDFSELLAADYYGPRAWYLEVVT
jgi:hypothetical protein